MTDTDDDGDDGISTEDWAQRRLEEVALGSTTSPVEGAKQSLGSYRRMLQLDNLLVFVINIVFLAIGAALVLQPTDQWVTWLAYVMIGTGVLGIADAVLGRLWMWFR